MGRGPELTFFWRWHTDEQQAPEKMLSITITREMYIKTIARRHPRHTSHLIISKKTKNYKHWRGRGEREPLCTVNRMQSSQFTVENGIEVPKKKLRVELPRDPIIPLLGMYMKKIKIQTVKDMCVHIFICNSQATEKNEVSINGIMDKEVAI